MNPTHLQPAQVQHLTADLRRLLTAADTEFVPPLSARTGTLDQQLGPAKASAAGVESYLAALGQQSLLAAYDHARVIAFMSYRPGHVVQVAGHDPLGPLAYVTTVVVAPSARRRGLARAMYETLLAELDGGPVATRTWSGNTAHLNLLADLGFDEVIRLTDDRGPGVDTVYLARPGTRAPRA